ncbi:MAG: diguanylate cyclase [Pseudodesulfovibrio sp.]
MGLEKTKIMIVEDIKANIRLLEKRLSKEYECLSAVNGEDALAVIRRERPDLVLLDIQMPGIDGFEVCRRLKADEATMHIPVVFLTSLSEDEDETKGLELGAVDYITKPFRMPIVKARIRNHLELKKIRDLLEQQAFIDGLTCIPNRRRFDEVLDREWYRAMRAQTPLSLILMDIDFFKKYNDNYGHKQGDTCLQQVAQTLSNSMQRTSDFVARYGGEEFVAILPETDSEGALLIADEIREALTELGIPHEFSDAAPHISLSQGIATFIPNQNQQPSDLIESADKLLYAAKEEGRNQAKVDSNAGSQQTSFFIG